MELPGEVRDQTLTGFARTIPTRASVWSAPDDRAIHAHLGDRFRRGVIARGLGRSYGDAAQNGGGWVIDSHLVSQIDLTQIDSGVVRCGAGVSLADLMATVIPRGWFPTVIPGTRFVTIGGAIAADIHGKYRLGSFADSVLHATLATSTGEALEINDRGDERARRAWRATIGGMGLTGVVTEASLQLHPIETSSMTVDTERCTDIDDCMERMLDRDHRYRYSVAWIDTMARGRNLGRAVLERANHTTRTEFASERAPFAYTVHPDIQAPPWFPNATISRLSVRAFNELWFRKAPRERSGHQQSIVSFFHPLDRIIGWNRVYGSRGFLQYQFVVPQGSESVVHHVLERLSTIGAPCFLAVLKRFESQNNGYLSFPMPGWTLTVDVPTNQEGLAELLDGVDRLVTDAGGRVYLAKDSRLDPTMLREMYPHLPEWRAERDQLDPTNTLRSDLARRLDMISRKEPA